MKYNQEREHTIQNMKDAGCSEDTINRFLLCDQAGDIKGELKVLANHRQTLLDEIHKGQKEIDCLDYLVYQIEKNVRRCSKIDDALRPHRQRTSKSHTEKMQKQHFS